MRTLKAKRRRSSYKSDTHFIRAVYLKNKEEIDRRIDPVFTQNRSPYEAFKSLVYDRMEDYNYSVGKEGEGKYRKYTISEAIRAVNNSTDMMGDYTDLDVAGKKKYVRAQNFYQLLRKGKDSFKEFRELALRNEKGRYTKYDPNQLLFRGYFHDEKGNFAAYQYGETMVIERQSPTDGTGASIEVTTLFEFEHNLEYTIFKGKF